MGLRLIDWFTERSRIEQGAILAAIVTLTAVSYGALLVILGVLLIADFLLSQR